MRIKKKNTLFRKYVLIISSVIFTSFIILGGALLFFISKSWVTEKDLLLKENAESIAGTTSELVESGYMRENENGSVLMICNTLSLVSSAIDSDIYITNTDGKVIYCRDLLRADMIVMPGGCEIHGKYNIPKQIIENAIKNKGYNTVSDLNGIYSSDNLVVAEPIFANGQAIGVVFAAQPIIGVMGPYVMSILKMFAFASIFALAIAFLTVYFMIYRLTKPLRQMSEATKSLLRVTSVTGFILKAMTSLRSLPELLTRWQKIWLLWNHPDEVLLQMYHMN